MNFRKIIIGTANFGMSYGIENKKTSIVQIKKILDYSKKIGINTIDTAPGYLDAQKKLSKNNMKSWKVITKISSIPKKTKNIEAYVLKNFFTSLKTLNIKRINTVLVHDEQDVFDINKGKKIFKALHYLKKKKFINRIGVSIYDPFKLFKIIGNYNIDVVQCPLNVFDRRLIYSGILKKLKINKIKLHLRSIFLQGLLLKEIKDLPKKFLRNKDLNNFKNLILKNNLTNLEACLSALENIDYEKIVIGVNNVEQLKEIVNCRNNILLKKIDLNIKSKNIIDPRKWSKFKTIK